MDVPKCFLGSGTQPTSGAVKPARRTVAQLQWAADKIADAMERMGDYEADKLAQCGQALAHLHSVQASVGIAADVVEAVEGLLDPAILKFAAKLLS